MRITRKDNKQKYGANLSHMYRVFLACITALFLVQSSAAAASGHSALENAAPNRHSATLHCDAPRRIIDAWLLYGHSLESLLHPHAFPLPISPEIDALSNVEGSSANLSLLTASSVKKKYQIQLTSSLQAFFQFRLYCNTAFAHFRSSNSTGILSATDAEMEDLCHAAYNISLDALGGNPPIEPLLLLAEWYILRGNLTAAHSTLVVASREQANTTVVWNIGSNWDMTYNRTLVDSHRLILLAWTLYHTGDINELDNLYVEMYENHFSEKKWMTLLQDRIIFGDLLRWQERMGTMQIEDARQQLATWKVYCQQNSTSHRHSCHELSSVIQSAGISSGAAIIQPDESITDEQLRTEFPNLLAFVQHQAGQPEREYEFEPITAALDAAAQNASLSSRLRFYYNALLHFRSSSTLPNQLALIVLNPAMRFTIVWHEHYVEFLNRLPAPFFFDMALFDMDMLVLPQCAKMRDQGEQYWAQMLPGSIAIKANAVLMTLRGADKLLLRRSPSTQQGDSVADTVFTNPPFYCHFGHEFTPADFVVLYPIHPLLMESYAPTALTELVPSADRNGDGEVDMRDVRVRLVLSKNALKPNQTEIDIMHRLQRTKQFQLKGSPSHPSTYRERPNESANWYSIHSADEAALCLTENWSMGSPRWLRWSDQCAEVGVDFWWIIRSVHPPSSNNNVTAVPPFDPKLKTAQYVTLEGSRGSFLFVQASSSDSESAADPFLRMRELLHSPPQSPYQFAPPECSVFRVENGQIFTCLNTSLLAHPFYHGLDENDKPVLMTNGAPLRNFSRTFIPAIHATEIAAKRKLASASIATVRFTAVLNPRKLQASVAYSYAQLPVRRIIWAMWTQGPESWPRLKKYNVLSWHATLNGVDSSNSTNRIGTDYLGVNSTDPNRWEIRILNLVEGHEDHLFNYVSKELIPPRFMELSATNQADVARQLLLMLYGGIWLDISVFLLKPPEWLRSDGPGVWNSFYIDDRYHSMPHAAEYFQGLELWASGSGVHSYIVEQNFLAQARTMVDLPRSTAIWLHPTMRNIDLSVMNANYNYFRMNLLMVKCLQDDPLTRALFVSHGNVRNARTRTGGYHWLSPFIAPWLNETNPNYQWDFKGATKLLIDPDVHAQDKQAWVKDIVQNDHMLEIPTGIAWPFRHDALSTTKTNLGFILRQPLLMRRKVAYRQAEVERNTVLSQHKP